MGSQLNKQQINHNNENNIELINPTRSTRSKSFIDNQDDFEECVLIWLDSTIRNSDIWSEELKYARQIINNIKIFDNPNDCIMFMKMVITDKIFLIVSQ